MSIISILALLSAISFGSGTSTRLEDTALSFGQTKEDYIQLSERIMDNSTSRFSLCTWMKKRFSGSSSPIVLHNFNNIVLGDNGSYNMVVDTNLVLFLQYNRNTAQGTWFHVCMTWSNEDKRIRVYLDGHLVGTSDETVRSELERGQGTCLGNQVYGNKVDYNVFGGDIFKLNIYNRVLTEKEIKNMSADMCSSEEDRLASIKVLSWENILSHKSGRHGNITEIPIRCRGNVTGNQREIEGLEEESTMSSSTNHQPVINFNEINIKIFAELESMRQDLEGSKKKTSKLEEALTQVIERLNRSEEKLSESTMTNEQLKRGQSDVLKRLEITKHELDLSKNKSVHLEEELDRSWNKTVHLEGKLIEVLRRLNDTEEELAGSRNKTAHLEEKLTDVVRRLDDTEEELAGSRNKTAHLEGELTEVVRKLNDTEEELAGSGNKTAHLEEKLTAFLGMVVGRLKEAGWELTHLEGKLSEVLGRLDETEGGLAGSRNKTAHLEEKLTDVVRKLDDTEEELAGSRNIWRES